MSEQANPTQRRINVTESLNVARLPDGESFDCNESKWQAEVHGVSGLTTFALRSAMSLVESVCRGKGHFDQKEVERWFAVNTVEATASGSGRTWNYVEANPNAAKVSGNLVCRTPGWHDFRDNDRPLTVNLGAQASANNPVNPIATFDVDDDFNTTGHALISKMLSNVGMPGWSNRLVYYFGAVIPQGFFCKLREQGAGGSAYVDRTARALAGAPHGFQTTIAGVSEKMDGILILLNAIASPALPEPAVMGAMNLLAGEFNKPEFANVLMEGYHFNKARDGFLALTEESPAENKNAVRNELNNVLMMLEMVVESRLTPDEKEVLFVMRAACVDMLAKIPAAPPPPAPKPRVRPKPVTPKPVTPKPEPPKTQTGGFVIPNPGKY